MNYKCPSCAMDGEELGRLYRSVFTERLKESAKRRIVAAMAGARRRKPRRFRTGAMAAALVGFVLAPSFMPRVEGIPSGAEVETRLSEVRERVFWLEAGYEPAGVSVDDLLRALRRRVDELTWDEKDM
ncbi:MAG: hypothetical protein HY716_08870 [Planctomycetes bacterium]|nr:hypothetical protein [Planctomycetota bacterium]